MKDKNKYNKLIKPKFWLVLTVLILHLSIIGLSQKATLEKGQTISTQSHLNDTAAIAKQLKLADDLIETFTDSSLKLINQAIESSRRIKFERGMATGYYQTGILYTSKSNYQGSIQAFKTALPYCGQSPATQDLRVLTLSAMASSYWYAGITDSAALYCYQALDDIETLQITKPLVLVNIYTKLLRLWLNLNDSPTDLANDKYMQHAITYLNKAELLENPDKAMKAKIVFSKGQLKELEKEYDSARHFYKLYLEEIRNGTVHKGRSISWVCAMLLNISNTFLLQKNADSTIWYANAAIAALPKNGNQQPTYFILAGYYTGKAYCLQKKYGEAIKATLPALQEAQQKNLFFMREMAHETLAEAYREIGNFKKALEQQTAYSAVKDSLMRKGKMLAISQMEMKYQVAEKDKAITEKELALVKKDNSIKSKNVWIATIAAGFILLIATSLTGFLRSRHRQQITALQTKQELELTRLQATISGEENERQRLARELHDGIGGQLGSMRLQLDTAIRKNVVTDDDGDFANVLHQLDDTYTELRKTAHNLMPETLVQEGLAKAVSVFCAGIGNGTGIEMTFESVGKIPRLAPTDELALYRMVQELVHNMVKHAKASQALVQIAYDGNTLGLTVEDNGVGIIEKTDKSSGGKGLGLVAIQERIKAMGGQMDIFSKPDKGTSINIELYTVNMNAVNNPG